jgi:phenolic acid decarboxylase
LATALPPSLSWGQEAPDQPFANVELEYTYPSAGTVVLTIGQGTLGYRWLTGQSAGTEVVDRLYKSRKVADDVFIVSWHNVEQSDFVSLVIDLKEMVVHGSALAAYGTENEFFFFDKAEIQRVDRRL